jgi:uncharacterized protein (DUF302 family)
MTGSLYKLFIAVYPVFSPILSQLVFREYFKKIENVLKRQGFAVIQKVFPDEELQDSLMD